MNLWRFKAPIYSAVRRLPVARGLLRVELRSIEKLLQLIPSPIARHLDIGSGTGDSLAIFPKCELRVCLDASSAMLSRLAEDNRVVGDALHLPFPNHTFELVSAIGLLEYVVDHKAFIFEAGRILRPGGCFVFTSSPRNAFNHLRTALGESLHLANSEDVLELLTRTNWEIVGKGQSWLQEQWLVKRSSY